LFRGFSIGDLEMFEHFVSSIVPLPFVQYREASTPRTHVSGHVFTSTEYPPDFRIHVHNENSHVTTWPLYVFFHCRVPAATGGGTPLADCRAIYQRLPADIRDRFEREGWLYRRNFLANGSISWQAALQVDSRVAAEEYCRANHLIPEWTQRGLSISYRRWAALRHPRTQDRVWFNHGLFFNPYTLEPILKEVLAGAHESDLPYNTYYGDGSIIDDATLRVLDEAYQSETATFGWNAGDILMVDNMRLAHGREAFMGQREVVVAMKSRQSFMDFDDCRSFALSIPIAGQGDLSASPRP
jgi:hypothetical protein